MTVPGGEYWLDQASDYDPELVECPECGSVHLEADTYFGFCHRACWDRAHGDPGFVSPDRLSDDELREQLMRTPMALATRRRALAQEWTLRHVRRRRSLRRAS